MNLDDYQRDAEKTAIYPTDGINGLAYVSLGLVGEAGEIANKVKKILRDSNGSMTEDTRMALVGEVGDVLWYVAMLAKELDTPLSQIAEWNIEKLNERKKRGTLRGSGDTR